MLKGYRTADKTENKQKVLKSFIYFVLLVKADGCSISRAGSKLAVATGLKPNRMGRCGNDSSKLSES
jgi:hypothetical protein